MPEGIHFENISRRFARPNAREVVAWFEGLFDPSSQVIMVSVFQMAILYAFQTSSSGINFKRSSKRYVLASRDDPQFNKRANHLSRWIQGIYGRNLKVHHARPRSSTILVRTMCIAGRVKEEVTDLSDVLLSEQQSIFRKVSDLAGIN